MALLDRAIRPKEKKYDIQIERKSYNPVNHNLKTSSEDYKDRQLNLVASGCKTNIET